MMEFFGLVLEPLQELFVRFRMFLPNLLAMLVIFVFGYLLARIARSLLVKSLNAMHFDSWSDRAGFTTLLRKGDLWHKPSVLVGAMAGWLLIIVTLVVGLGALKIPAIDLFVAHFFEYLPRAFSAAIILFAGYLLAGFFARGLLITAVNLGLHYAKALSGIVRFLLMMLFLAMAMEQLQIAPAIVLAAFSILFGGIVIALSIAFGVAGIDAAKRMIESEALNRRENGVGKDIEHM